MKWPRWFPRLAIEPLTTDSRREVRIPTPPAELGIRDVGTCEVCGRPMKARTRRREFRGRVDCDCGSRNHVEYRDVRVNGDLKPQHVSVTTGRRFESTVHRPDLRLAWRFGVCPSCSTAVRLQEAHAISIEDASGTRETIAYYCDECHTHDDFRRGRLMGHDGTPLVDTLSFQAPPAARTSAAG